MKIKKVLTSVGLTGFYMDDKAAIKAGAKIDNFAYIGKPLTPGFTRVREPGESVSVMFVMDTGDIVYGDCAVAQYAASGGRELPQRAKDLVAMMEKQITAQLEGREIDKFRPFAAEVDKLTYQGQQIPAALRYGITQAILEAVARKRYTPDEIREISDAAMLNPKPEKAYFWLGAAYEKKGDLPNAVKYYKKAVEKLIKE